MITRDIVINVCFGGFSVSKAACEHMGIEWDGYGHMSELSRDDARLVSAVRELGASANGAHAKLRIVTIPADVNWQIEEYDGNEHIAEVHRTWS